MLTAADRDNDELAAGIDGIKRQIAFYASTPTHLPVLDLDGWAGVGARQSPIAKQGPWAEMGTLIDDDILTKFAVVGPPDQVAYDLLNRFGSLARSVFFSTPYPHDSTIWSDVRRAMHAGTNSPT